MADVTAGATAVRGDSELRSLTLISIAHWVSHYHIYTLPMLYPFLKQRLGSDFVELGLSMSIFGVVSGVTQAPFGYVVDRIGARKVLIAGLLLGGASLVLLGLNLNYGMLLVCGALLGLANSVYHPADYALLAANIQGPRIGRAFSIHSFAGFFGGAVAPATVAALVATVGGEGALIVSGAIGLAVALLLIVVPMPEAERTSADDASTLGRTNMLTPTVIMLALFFALLGLSSGGITTFGIPALTTGYGQTYSAASFALTAYMMASAVGVLAGGLLADWTRHHARVATVCFALNLLLTLAIAVTAPGTLVLTLILTLAGFLYGLITPSRDMMVRNAAPPGAAGRVFGIVSTGFNVSGILAPLLFGFIMDQALPRWVFGLSAAFMIPALVLTMVTDRRSGASRSAAQRA